MLTFLLTATVLTPCFSRTSRWPLWPDRRRRRSLSMIAVRKVEGENHGHD